MNIKYTAGVCALVLVLSGCGADDEDRYCGKHHKYHKDHLFKVASLVVRYERPGQVRAQFSADQSIFKFDDMGKDRVMPLGDVLRVLADANKVLTIEGHSECVLVNRRVDDAEGKITADYHFDCGTANNLKRVDINLMNHLPTLYEIEADIETPAVRKVFLINQKCDRAIYNYE